MEKVTLIEGDIKVMSTIIYATSADENKNKSIASRAVVETPLRYLSVLLGIGCGRIPGGSQMQTGCLLHC